MVIVKFDVSYAILLLGQAAPVRPFCCRTSLYETKNKLQTLWLLPINFTTVGVIVFLDASTTKMHLELSLFSWGCLAGSSDGLDQAESAVLDGSDGSLFVVLELLISLLEFLDLGREVGFGISGLLVTIGDGSGDLLVGHLLHLGNLGLLLIVAEVDVGRRARGLEAGGVLFKRLEVAAALVVLEVVGVTCLNSGETLDTLGIAERFAGSGAVNVSNENSGMAVELCHEFIPIRLHLLAVSSPWCLEFDEDGLTGSGGVPIVGSEFGRGGEANDGEEECSELHVVNSQ